MSHRSNRRDFLKTTSTAALAGATLPYWFTAESNRALGFQSVNSRPVLGCIGTGDRWHQVVGGALNHSDGVAVCDVDRLHMEQGRDKVKDIQAKKGKDATVEMYEDYRKLLDRKDIPTVVFSHPPLASVGLTEEDARAQHGDAVRAYRTGFRPMLHALADSPQRSLFKLVCVGDERRIVGIHLLGEGADEILQGFAVALKRGITLDDLRDTVAIHPTAAEEFVTMRTPVPRLKQAVE